ncbi:unnamed protein product [Mytilus edulis]|uniref:Uncharacterized protein n=1 Tax=Mytilus edulis TaxID=6550 RepID=A0A8S3SCB0_MYTED|nr:unnamed protein product [Mytilus edulis]
MEMDTLGAVAAIADEEYQWLIPDFYGLHQYQWLSANTRHFNIPILYGEPMVGKTLIAMCAAWLTGCKETHIASRCTLAFVNSWLTKSTLPFIWDDPTTAEDVSQVAVDVYTWQINRPVYQTPLTGCMVTANFDLNYFMKYFRWVLVIKVEPPTKEKRPGDAKVLGDHSKLPVIEQFNLQFKDSRKYESEIQTQKSKINSELVDVCSPGFDDTVESEWTRFKSELYSSKKSLQMYTWEAAADAYMTKYPNLFTMIEIDVCCDVKYGIRASEIAKATMLGKCLTIEIDVCCDVKYGIRASEIAKATILGTCLEEMSDPPNEPLMTLKLKLKSS